MSESMEEDEVGWRLEWLRIEAAGLMAHHQDQEEVAMVMAMDHLDRMGEEVMVRHHAAATGHHQEEEAAMAHRCEVTAEVE